MPGTPRAPRCPGPTLPHSAAAPGAGSSALTARARLADWALGPGAFLSPHFTGEETVTRAQGDREDVCGRAGVRAQAELTDPACEDPEGRKRGTGRGRQSAEKAPQRRPPGLPCAPDADGERGAAGHVRWRGPAGARRCGRLPPTLLLSWSLHPPPSLSLRSGPGGQESVCVRGSDLPRTPPAPARAWEFPASPSCRQGCFILVETWGPRNFGMKGPPPGPSGMQEESPALRHPHPRTPCPQQREGGWEGRRSLPVQSRGCR